MNLTDTIFNSLQGKAAGGFNDVNTYLEVGVREGKTFQSRVPNVAVKAVALDCWDLFETSAQNDMNRTRNEAADQYANLARQYKDNNKVDIVRGFSNDKNIINSYPDSYFDLIFIDGDHSYEGVKEDLTNWWSKCNTLFCGHDYMLSKAVWNGVECGVKRAVDEFVQEHKNQIKAFRVYTQSSNPTWFIWKS